MSIAKGTMQLVVAIVRVARDISILQNLNCKYLINIQKLRSLACAPMALGLPATTVAFRTARTGSSRTPSAASPAQGRCPAALFLPTPAAGTGFVVARRASALLVPTAAGVAVSFAVCRGILVAICGLADCGAVAVLARSCISRTAVRTVRLRGGSVSVGLVLAVHGGAIFRSGRGPGAAIRIGPLHCRGRRPGVRVVRLSAAYAAVTV